MNSNQKQSFRTNLAQFNPSLRGDPLSKVVTQSFGLEGLLNRNTPTKYQTHTSQKPIPLDHGIQPINIRSLLVPEDSQPYQLKAQLQEYFYKNLCHVISEHLSCCTNLGDLFFQFSDLLKFLILLYDNIDPKLRQSNNSDSSKDVQLILNSNGSQNIPKYQHSEKEIQFKQDKSNHLQLHQFQPAYYQDVLNDNLSEDVPYIQSNFESHRSDDPQAIFSNLQSPPQDRLITNLSNFYQLSANKYEDGEFNESNSCIVHLHQATGPNWSIDNESPLKENESLLKSQASVAGFKSKAQNLNEELRALINSSKDQASINSYQ